MENASQGGQRRIRGPTILRAGYTDVAVNRARDWLSQAERDLQAAEDSAAAGHHEALVQSLHGMARGHSVTTILLQLPSTVTVPERVLDAAREVDKVYVTARYPNGLAEGVPGDYFTARTSKDLASHGRTVLEFCRGFVS